MDSVQDSILEEWGRDIHCGLNFDIANCSKSAIVAGKNSTKYNRYTVISIHNGRFNEFKNVLNYKCKPLSNCGTNKAVISNFSSKYLVLSPIS